MTGKQCYGIGQSGKRIDLDQTESCRERGV